MQIEDGKIYQLDSLDNNLIESYDINIDFSDNILGANFVFNPILVNRMTKNQEYSVGPSGVSSEIYLSVAI
ncbi:MAG TPA: hypothetical protein VK017_13745 [Sphingobacterium sp.]|nr:hypothetical protein [Sphingobacterium sp.]